MTSDEAKQKLILSGRILARHGHGDMTRGHVSVRVPDQPDLFYMKAHSLGSGRDHPREHPNHRARRRGCGWHRSAT